MISGRGLGPHRRDAGQAAVDPRLRRRARQRELRAAVASAGCAIVGQTATLAPADRRLYAIRDATGTVESIPLIVASILSKKLAAGLSALVMDVKVGSGAFLPDREKRARAGAGDRRGRAGNGLPTSALLTDMDRVLGRTAGNARRGARVDRPPHGREDTTSACARSRSRCARSCCASAASMQQLARGAVTRTLVPVEPPLLFEEAMELDHPLVLLEPLAFLLAHMLDQLCARLAARALAAQKLSLQLESQRISFSGRDHPKHRSRTKIFLRCVRPIPRLRRHRRPRSEPGGDGRPPGACTSGAIEVPSASAERANPFPVQSASTHSSPFTRTLSIFPFPCSTPKCSSSFCSLISSSFSGRLF